MLAYALLPFVSFPESKLALNFLGAVFVIQVDFATVVAVISAGLAAAGTDWLLRDHPRLGSVSTFQHWIIPALTAWVLGVPLNSLAVGWQWWAVFGFGGLLLVMVLLAEYIAVDPADTRFGPASVGLTAVSYALFLMLSIALAGAGVRLYVLAPAVGLAIFAITLRSLYMRLNGRWYFAWALAVALVVTQVAAALHYWPLNPVRFGLVVMGLAYALANVAGSIEEGRSGRALWIEPAVMLAAMLALAIGLK